MTGYNYEVALYISPQFEQQGVTFFIPSQVEPSLGLIGASLPALWPLFRAGSERIYSRLTAYSTSKRGQSAKATAEPRKDTISPFGGDGKFYPLPELRDEVELQRVV